MEAQVAAEQQWWKTWGSLLVSSDSVMPDPSWTTSKLHPSYDLVAPYVPSSCSTVLASWPLMSHGQGLICPSAQEHAKSYFLSSGSFSTADGMALFQNPRGLRGNFPFGAFPKLHLASLPITDTLMPVMWLAQRGCLHSNLDLLLGFFPQS